MKRQIRSTLNSYAKQLYLSDRSYIRKEEVEKFKNKVTFSDNIKNDAKEIVDDLENLLQKYEPRKIEHSQYNYQRKYLEMDVTYEFCFEIAPEAKFIFYKLNAFREYYIKEKGKWCKTVDRYLDKEFNKRGYECVHWIWYKGLFEFSTYTKILNHYYKQASKDKKEELDYEDESRKKSNKEWKKYIDKQYGAI